MWGSGLKLHLCTPTPWCKQQPCVISPSVCLLKSYMQASTFAPSPFSARASAIRSRTCGRQRLAFLAVSATGGARKPNPSEGAEGAAAPRTDLAQCEKYHNRHSVDAMPCRGIQPFRQALLILKGLPPPLTQGRRETRSVAVIKAVEDPLSHAYESLRRDSSPYE